MTARRFDLTGSGTAAVSPNFGSLWGSTGSAVRFPLPAARTTSTATSNGVAETSAANIDVATHQWVSDETFATAGSCNPSDFSTVLRTSESSGSLNGYLQVVIRVTSGDGLTERGVLFAGQTATTASGTSSDPNGEFSTTTRTRFLSAIACSPVTVQVGDRLVIEYGYRACNTSATSFTGTLFVGSAAGTDLTLAADSTSTNRPWIEFSSDPFAVAASTTVNGGQATETDSALTGAVTAGALVAGGQATETDSALAGSVTAGSVIAGGIATETDSALAGAVVQGVIVPGGRATETDTALAGSVAAGAVVAGGIATETDTALAGTALETIFISGGIATETDTALPGNVVDGDSVAGGIAAETDMALPGTVVLGYATTDISNSVSGLDLGGYGIATWEPAVVAPPAALAPVHDYNVARAYAAPALVNGRPVEIVTATAQAKRLCDRVMVGGKDVTFWRGIQTPTPAYQLIDPLLYGPGRLSLPQVSLTFGERVGEGDLTWLKPDAVVKVQRVDPDTNTVEATDYIGIITRFDVDGNTLVCELGGLVAGYAQDMERQQPIFRKVKDAGNWIYSAVTQAAPVAFTPRLGPNTGIDLVSIGGMGHLDWINTLCSLAVTDDGEQYTVGRRDNGTWGMWLKDTETIHATVYFDDADMKPSLVRDTSEEPNRVYAFGIDKDGERINFAKYPGLRQGEPAPYPFGSGESFDEGTTDADTDDPAAGLITAMLNMMVTVGLISSAQNTGTYNAAVTRAVRDIQDEAGLAETGVMNPATWNALWDLSVVGYSLANSRYEPAAQRPSVKKYLLSSSGAIIGRNPNYKPGKRKVDRTIQAGSGMTGRPQLRKFARHKLGTENNWIGSFTANLALIHGEHTPGDPIDPADVMDPRDLKPGMNLWAPLWNGGTLFHVPGLQFPEGGRAPTIALDTSARPSQEAWQIIARNKESRLDPARIWLRQNRSSQMSKDVKEWDSVCGWINDRVFCRAGKWTTFAVPAGQAGTISRLRLRTRNSKSRHAIVVTARSISPAALNRRNPEPLSEAGTAKWDKPAMVNWLESRGRVFVGGGYHQAGGYFPGKEYTFNDEPSGDPITGVSDTEASFGYHTFAEPVLYVSVWVAEDCWIPAGRVMWGQLEAGS